MSKRRDAQYLKRGYLLPDVINPTDCVSVCVSIPDDPNHIRAFLGQIDMLGYWWTWERDSQKRATQAARVWREIADCIREQLPGGTIKMSCCCDPTGIINHRVNQGTGRLEISTDDGTTWIQDPQDPGVSATQLPPPVVSGVASNKCNAAANAKANIQDWVSEINSKKSAGVSFVDFLAAVALVVILVFVEASTAGTFTALILPIIFATAKLVFQMDNAAFADYWSSTVYDDIVCIFFCAMENDGSLTQAGYNQVISQIEAKLPAGTPRDALRDMLKARGVVGVNNMASMGTATTDCSNCNCDCAYNLYAFGGASISYKGSCAWEVVAVLNPGDGKYYASVSTTDGDTDINLCASATWVLVSGTNPNVTVTRMCGSTVNDFNAFHWHNSHYWSLVSNGAFTARFTLADPTP